MYTVLVCLLLLGGLTGLLIVEYRLHLHNLYSIPIRIHVNGSRGKSSVTRLIAAGLREHGLKTFAKTTGTLPRLIMADGTEYPIFRPARANIIEQVRIITFVSSQKAEVLVIECMALQPPLQTLTEIKLIKSTHGVITNVRPDHLDIMGPAEKDVALALLGTTPFGAGLYTCEQDYPAEFKDACKDRNCELFLVGSEDIAQISDEDMQGFRYVEHKENVALALKVCRSLGVSNKIALRGMWRAIPDFGALSEVRLSFFGRNLIFINGFAANDPESSEYIWRLAIDRHRLCERKIMIINTRSDRPDRSRQLGEAISKWPIPYKYVVMGSDSFRFVRVAVNSGVHPSLFMNVQGLNAEYVFEKIIALSGKSAMIIGIGNIAGSGMDLVTYFLNRADPEIKEDVNV